MNMKDRRKSSAVWSYFTPNDDKVAECNFCKNRLSYKSSVTNLQKHLEKKHKAAYAYVRNKIRTPKTHSEEKRSERRQVVHERPHVIAFRPPQEAEEEMKVTVQTADGISMTYLTKRKEITFDLTDHIVKQVKLISRKEIVTMEDDDGRYHLSAKRNTENIPQDPFYQTTTENAESAVNCESEQEGGVRIVEGTVRSEQILESDADDEVTEVVSEEYVYEKMDL